MFIVYSRFFDCQADFSKNLEKVFSVERDPAGASLDNSLESLIGVNNPLFPFFDGLFQNLKTFDK